ncbi:MAG: hypothetical protein M2R45_02745 [Verrucomicrobia subdivision 3 bacterium]|nr:hypothetical protein [Limisphaerales bacterium]MCS1414295.1 hypothetical protein [Limisphaerales bacterium]
MLPAISFQLERNNGQRRGFAPNTPRQKHYSENIFSPRPKNQPYEPAISRRSVAIPGETIKLIAT